MQRETDAVVGDPVLLVVVRADLVGATPALHLVAPRRRQLRLLTFALDLVEAAAQDAHRLLLVLQLALLVLARDDESRRVVGAAHGGVGGVHRLPARSARPVHVDVEIVGIDFHVDLFRLGEHGHRRRARVHPALALRDWYPLHAVWTGFVLEPRPRVVT